MTKQRPTTLRRKIKVFRDQHILGVLFILMVLSAYYRGLYFDFERFFFYSIFWVVAGIFFFIRFFAFQEQISFKTGVEWSFLFLTLLYLINVVWAADKGLAFREFLTYFNFLVFFFVVEHVSSSWKGDKHWFLFLFGLSAIVLIFLSLGYHFGIIPPTVLPTYMSLRELFVGSRMYSNFQYPNTAAAYFAMAYFGMLTFSFWEERRFWRGLAFFCSFLILVGVMFTYSRGVFLTLLLTSLFLIAILPGELKIRFLFVGIISLAFLGMSFPFLERYLFDFQSGAFFVLLFGTALVIGMVLESFVEREDKLLRLSNRFYGLLGVGMAGGGVLIFLLGKYSSLLPAYFMQRIRGISFTDPNVVGRLTFYRDALKIGLDRPINGWGGGGWKVLYLGYQSTPYFTESTHNYYAQVFVEGGFLGIALIIALLFFLFWETWKVKEVLPEKERFLALGILGMLFMGFVHGILDINFSLGAYQFAVWFFAGILGGMTRNAASRPVFYLP
ncbi:MAG: O-antigen ligase family protein, partial [Candidatus Caldatribacteriaceae bacterium]